MYSNDKESSCMKGITCFLSRLFLYYVLVIWFTDFEVALTKNIAGQVFSPHYKKVFSGVSSFVTTSAYRALTGTRWVRFCACVLFDILCVHWGFRFNFLSLPLIHLQFSFLRTSPTLGTALPSTMPWMIIPGKEYWCICYNSILACMSEHHFHWC